LAQVADAILNAFEPKKAAAKLATVVIAARVLEYSGADELLNPALG
jgi:hypothetical protein